MIEIEKMGKPAVPIVSGRFEEDAIASARTFAMPDLQFVVVPRIYRNLAHDECARQTEAVIDDLVHILTNRDDSKRLSAIETADRHRFEGSDRYDAVLRMNEDFIMRDWGDGFPLCPATREAVDELMRGTSLAPDHLVCDMPPGFGLATVEKIAINAAMAGARPAHMPVILAAVRALSQLGSHGKSLLMSTSCHAPMLVSTDPSPKSWVSIPAPDWGRGATTRSISPSAVHSRCACGISDTGTPVRWTWTPLAPPENSFTALPRTEAMSPWEPYHVDRGLSGRKCNQHFVTDELDVQDQEQYHWRRASKTIPAAGTRSLGERHTAERLILCRRMCPTSGSQGFSKRAPKFIHLPNASLGKMIQYMPLEGEARVAANWKWLETLSEQERLDMTVPVLESADRYDIVVIGADRAKTLVMPSGPSSVTVGIDAYR